MYVGLDVSVDETSVRIVDQDCQIGREMKGARTAFWLAAGGILLCLPVTAALRRRDCRDARGELRSPARQV